jgi:hypothetical protein
MNALALTLAFVGLILIIQGGYDQELRKERDRADRIADGLRRHRASSGAVDPSLPAWPGGMRGWPWAAAEAGGGAGAPGDVPGWQYGAGSHSGAPLFADETTWKYRESVDLPDRGGWQGGAAGAPSVAEGFAGEPAAARARRRRRAKAEADDGGKRRRRPGVPTTGPLRPPAATARPPRPPG